MIGTQGRNTTYDQYVRSYSVRYSSTGIIFSTIQDASLKEKVEYSFKQTPISRYHFVNGNRCATANGRVRYFDNLFFFRENELLNWVWGHQLLKNMENPGRWGPKWNSLIGGRGNEHFLEPHFWQEFFSKASVVIEYDSYFWCQ